MGGAGVLKPGDDQGAWGLGVGGGAAALYLPRLRLEPGSTLLSPFPPQWGCQECLVLVDLTHLWEHKSEGEWDSRRGTCTADGHTTERSVQWLRRPSCPAQS